MRASIRFLTALALIAISGLAVAQGWRIVHFSLAAMNIESAEKRAEVVNTWRTTAGVASAALQADLTGEVNPSDMIAAYRRREVLSEILSIKPMSSMDWFSLSNIGLLTNRPMEDVLGSLKLSILTGPNEAYIMVKRGLFGVSLWEHLSPILKSGVANDLVPILFPRTPDEGRETGILRALLSAKPKQVRTEIRDALLAIGVSPKAIKQTVGL